MKTEEMVSCLELAQKTLEQHQQAINDLKIIVQLQQQNSEQQAISLRGLQAMCRNLDQRIKQQEGFAAGQFGMQLKDYFAAAVVNGLMAGEGLRACNNHREIADSAYNIAEGMLEERDKRNENQRR